MFIIHIRDEESGQMTSEQVNEVIVRRDDRYTYEDIHVYSHNVDDNIGLVRELVNNYNVSFTTVSNGNFAHYDGNKFLIM